ncbi:MAG: hypothetical protein OEZ10_05215 [Gammaproteobacteria bacterium]|nr:hypothetical protein [Gammaproteobacteria bacterium]
MTESTVYIHAASAIDPALNTDPSSRQALTGLPEKADATARVKQLIGDPLRQASHLVKMAVIGIMSCRQQVRLPVDNNAAIYVGTGLGEMDKCRGLFEQVMPPANGMASPFDFINSSSNIAAFYVAKILGLSTRNLTISQDEFSFEYALKLAIDDIVSDGYTHAFAGGLDERSLDIDYQLRRIQIRNDQVLGEGCGWLYLSQESSGARATISAPVFVAGNNPASNDEWLKSILPAIPEPYNNPVILPGFRITPETISNLEKLGYQVRPYVQYSGCYHTAAAFGIADAVNNAAAGTTLVHINRDPIGNSAITLANTLA